MDLVKHLRILGGASSRAVIVERCGRSEFDKAVRSGVLVRVARGRYALASADRAVHRAARWGGVLALRSAAQRHGWGQRKVPDKPDVVFARTHRVPSEARREIVPHWFNLTDGDVEGAVTTKRRTLIDCMRNLPLVESLPIVNSALRAGDITAEELRELADSMQGRSRTRAQGVAAMASAKPVNPYESTLWAIAAQVPLLNVTPQHEILTSLGPRHPDLLDAELRLVIEAESFAWHGKTAALTRDCVRYNAFVIADYSVVRFSWYQVMFEPAYVVGVLVGAARLAREHANVARGPTALAA